MLCCEGAQPEACEWGLCCAVRVRPCGLAIVRPCGLAPHLCMPWPISVCPACRTPLPAGARPADLADLEGRHAAHVANLMARHEAAFADMRAYYTQAGWEGASRRVGGAPANQHGWLGLPSAGTAGPVALRCHAI